MEVTDNIKKQAKKAAVIIGIATFVGYSAIMLLPGVYRNPFTPYLIIFYLMFSPLGIIESFIFGRIAYIIFKFIKNKLLYRGSLIIGIIICIALGAVSQVYIWRQFSKTKPYMNKIDTNGDGRIDKWVYDDDLNTRIELDSNYDGEPDIKEYYKNGKFIRKEIKVGSEWK